MSEPCLVVIGHVNHGKSSVVATLAADDTLEISPVPGTTVLNRDIPVVVNGKTIYRVIDTPGFERARATLQWLKQTNPGPSERPQRLRQFVEAHRDDPRFSAECQLLEPMLAGATALYVVDASEKYLPDFEPELEILQWTGGPRIALMNHIGQDDHAASWHALHQYFSTVVPFNAHGADHADRISLLRTLREIDRAAQPRFDEAIAAMEVDRQRQLDSSADAIAVMLTDLAGLVVRKRRREDADVEQIKARAKAEYHERVARIERETWTTLRAIYGFRRLEISDAAARAGLNTDAFSEHTRLAFGPTWEQFSQTVMAIGGIIGALVDVGHGLLSMGVYAVAGVGGGYLLALGLWNGVLEPKVGRKFVELGLMKNPRDHWVFLRRALKLHRDLAYRAHARQGAVVLETKDSDITPKLAAEVSAALTLLHSGVRSPDQARRTIAKTIRPLLEQRDPTPDPAAH
jgi:hypothetical protein